MPEEFLAAAVQVKRIGKIAKYSLDLLLGIADPLQDAFDFLVRNESALFHAPDATPRLTAHPKRPRGSEGAPT